nr:unnamed protein product [Callosobruchus analis]
MAPICCVSPTTASGSVWWKHNYDFVVDSRQSPLFPLRSPRLKSHKSEARASRKRRSLSSSSSTARIPVKTASWTLPTLSSI